MCLGVPDQKFTESVAQQANEGKLAWMLVTWIGSPT